MTTEEKQLVDAPDILFFCRECQKIVKEPKKIGSKYIYKCPVCSSENVAFGTRKSVCSYFHVKDKELEEIYGNV
ncbi:MAG: hypothetical protein ABII07_05890 [Patescibacteria group bacterium]|nr:hypothetical protein [Patescibacteria group bacterium]